MIKNESSILYTKCKVMFKRYLNNKGINSGVISDLFGLSTYKAKLFVERNRLQNKEADLLINSINFCRKLGYSKEDILRTPSLLRVHPLELEQHYLTYEEGGFQLISPRVLARARNYMRKVIRMLKSNNLIAEDTDVAQNFLKYIQDQEIVEKLSTHQFSDDDKWNEVHKCLLQSFLKVRLDATDDDIIKLFRIHRMIKNKSFRVVQENLAIAEDLGFENHKILKFGYLLHNYPTYPKTVLRDFPNIAGADMRKSMRVYPKLVMVSPKNIIKIYGILKEYDIEDELIRNQMNVFNMSPETVRLRLEEIDRSPDFRVLLKHPKVLSLIIHHNRAKTRLSYLQQLKLRCASLAIIRTNDEEKFHSYVRDGQDCNKPSDVLIFLAKLFNENKELIREKLKSHPFHLKVPLKDMQNTYNFLIRQQFLSKNIFKVLQILLYPEEKIVKALEEINNKELNACKQEKQLNLILYLIEKEHHFTGNGIWRDSNKTDTDIVEKSLE